MADCKRGGTKRVPCPHALPNDECEQNDMPGWFDCPPDAWDDNAEVMPCTVPCSCAQEGGGEVVVSTGSGQVTVGPDGEGLNDAVEMVTGQLTNMMTEAARKMLVKRVRDLERALAAERERAEQLRAWAEKQYKHMKGAADDCEYHTGTDSNPVCREYRERANIYKHIMDTLTRGGERTCGKEG